MSKNVVIRPIQKKKCLGNNGDEYFTCPIVIRALKNDMGFLETGLTDKERADLQKHFHYKLDNKFDPFDKDLIWNTSDGRFVLTAKTTILDLSKPIDMLRYGLCKASKYVANSRQELDEHKWPYAKYVIEDSDELVEEQAKRNELKMKVYTAVEKLDLKQKRDFCTILGFNTRGLSDVAVSNTVFNAIETKGYKAAYDVIKQSKEYNALNALIAEAVNRHVISKKGEVYSFMGEQIGVSMSSTIEFLKDVKNNNVKAAIINQLNE